MKNTRLTMCSLKGYPLPCPTVDTAVNEIKILKNKIRFYCKSICGVYRKNKTCITCILREGLEVEDE
jgi:hypothetical protein